MTLVHVCMTHMYDSYDSYDCVVLDQTGALLACDDEGVQERHCMGDPDAEVKKLSWLLKQRMS